MVEPAKKEQEIPSQEIDQEDEEKEPELLKATPGEAEIKLTQLDFKIKGSFEDRQKYQLIFDTTGECEVFFRYKAHMIDINKLKISMSLGRITKDEAIEQMRKALVYAMRIGDRLVLNCGKYMIDFRNDFTDPVNFPCDLIFNFDEWRKEENYKRVVRPEEDVDLIGNKKCYFMNDNFDIIILQDVKDVKVEEDQRETFKTKIPNCNMCFETFFVTRFGNPLDLSTVPKPQAYHPIGQTGMHVVNFGKNNVTHTYHSFDYADIYDPVRPKKHCQGGRMY